jgi:protein transport protein SEC24
VRCRDCRAYVNPFVRFIENGMKWICNFCGEINPTENYYYSPLNSLGQRQDYEDRLELSKGSVDFIASNEYMNRPPMPPTYIFVLDVSKPAIDTGYLTLATQTIKSVIESKLLPGGERTRISFITYDASVQFYNLRPTLKQPQMFVLTDIQEMFLPQPEDMIVNLSDSYDLVVNLLDNLPSFFSKNSSVDSCFVAALQAANLVGQSIGGKIVFFQVSSTVIKHPVLMPKTLPNTAERIDLVNSTNPYFANTGSDLAHMHMSVDLYVLTHGKNQYKNLQTFADISRKSSGNLYYYQEFSTRTQGLKFSNELYHNLVRRTSWEGVFRIRVSAGFNQIRSFGNIQIKAKTADLILCPALDSDRVFAYEIEKTDVLNEDPNRLARRDSSHLYIQSALLYSTSEGERRIRVHNFAVPLTNMKHVPYEYIDINACTNYFARLALNSVSQELLVITFV